MKLGGPRQHREQGPEGKLWADEEQRDLLTLSTQWKQVLEILRVSTSFK